MDLRDAGALVRSLQTTLREGYRRGLSKTRSREGHLRGGLVTGEQTLGGDGKIEAEDRAEGTGRDGNGREGSWAGREAEEDEETATGRDNSCFT